MTHTGIDYDVTAAMAAMVLAAPDASAADLKGMLVAGSDIPEEKLDFALSELREGVEALRSMTTLLELGYGRKPTVSEIQQMIAGATWIDDDKGEATYNTTVVNEEGDELATATVKTKLNQQG